MSKQMAKHIADYISKMLLEERKEQNNILDSLQHGVFAPVLVVAKQGKLHKLLASNPSAYPDHIFN